MKHSLHTLPLGNSFAKLPGIFHSRVQPTPFEQPAELIHFNSAAAELLDLDPAAASDPACADIFSGRHRFGHYVPQPGVESARAALRSHARSDAAHQASMQTVNPKYVLRNCMAQIAIDKAVQDQDYTEIDHQFKLLQPPFDEHPDMGHYGHPATRPGQTPPRQLFFLGPVNTMEVVALLPQNGPGTNSRRFRRGARREV